jgi:signal transduction histidine kinase
MISFEDLQKRLFALHDASLELVKDTSLETLLERIATTAREQANAQYAALAVLDEEGKISQFIPVGMTEAQINAIGRLPEGRGLLKAILEENAPIRIPNITKDPRSAGFPPNHPRMTSFLGVPIRLGECRLGQLYLTDKLDRESFTDDDEEIIQVLASYAAVAIQNARLCKELRDRDIALTRQSENLSLLNDVASALASTLELDEILDKTLGLVMEYLHVEAGEIFLLDHNRQTLSLVLHRGEAAEAFWTRSQFKLGEGAIGRVAESGKPIVSADFSNEMGYLRPAVKEAGFEQFLCIPLLSGEKTIGVLGAVTRRKAPLDDRSVQLLTAVGNWAGLAIENARLHSNARRLAVLEERERIGMDLHDGVIQSIFGVGLSLENIYHLINEDPAEAKRRIQQAIDGLNQTIRDLRTYILDLRPRQLGDENLMEGLKRLVREYRVNTLAEAMLSGKAEELENLPQEQALALFHICQEALANTAKHAHARRVSVTLWTTPERVLMEIQDNGRGFDLDKMSMTLGHGLANMHTRIRNVGGEVDISSEPGEGTTILAWVPRNPTP